jgi:RNA polymerase sigma-70 factor (ECF subfamily)
METLKTFSQLSEVDLIGKIVSGEVALFEILIRRYNPVLYKTGRSYAFNHHDVEDLMQESFISAYLNLSQFQGRSSFQTWIIKIMLNSCNRKRMKLSFKNEINFDEITNENKIPMFSDRQYTNADKIISNRELGHVIEKLITAMPFDYRIVFTLRELNAMSVLETSETLGISEANVKVRLNRAKHMLRSQVEKMYSPADLFEFKLKYCDGLVERVMKEIK